METCRNVRKPLRLAAEIGGVSVGGNPLGPAAPSPVLPLEDLFDQPTIQTISQLSEQPSMADLDALAPDPSPLLDAGPRTGLRREGPLAFYRRESRLRSSLSTTKPRSKPTSTRAILIVGAWVASA